MSNTEASEENVKSPSTYGNEGYQEYRKKEKKKNRLNSECLACGHKRKDHNVETNRVVTNLNVRA